MNEYKYMLVKNIHVPVYVGRTRVPGSPLDRQIDGHIWSCGRHAVETGGPNVRLPDI